MEWLIAGLAGLSLLFVSILYLFYRQLISLCEQLRMMRQKPFNNMLLRVDKGSSAFKEMVVELNAILEELRSSNRKLNAQRENFKSQISSISHDLRTPLTSIMGYIELAEEETDGVKRNEYLDVIRRRSKILQTLLTDFYDLSRLEDMDNGLQLEYLAVEPILEDCILTFYEDFVNKDFKLTIEIDQGLKVWGGRQEFIRIYTNLIQNILKHGYGKAQIRHHIRNNKTFTVFSNEVLNPDMINTERIFERFYTGDASRSNQNTGLGLYTVRLLLEKMGHRVTAECIANRLLIKIEYLNNNFST